MAVVRGCEIPDDLYYDIENNIWARRETDGTVTIGLTSYACSLAGEFLAYFARGVGKEVRQGRFCATVESGKWVGSVKAPVSGTITAVNDGVSVAPELINREPYSGGWLCRIRPDDWGRESADLKTGADAIAAFNAKMEADGFGGC